MVALKYYHKALLQNRFVVEIVLYEVTVTQKYPDGVKYRLICVDQKENRKILMDNHHPKGHHVHINDKEVEYHFISEDNLISDFNQLVLTHMGVRL
ncbi:MAG: hypothetical protein A2Z91_02785 [Deltaproteobacteria bacterium GWA2_38_16]|nr:MAG: hypothetical protein A2Z91_02785 [Deltaproteobacteria bacterium GWA2_38_16]OGQ02815.1 MAG: hypothetical protein A3D19_06210 [Deltaproteobacteria bacterium RIFCSPHIGHO2_02_FULL_38_15]OGQ34907.1 MAG: hypothetical protein A3A72_00440 [Deltaproteobacteria bacterium RIFCSPLOWO2_01_FULL_38_9]HBQ21657.1 hypothetical protein [Deltaproteobacteria bacterium]